MDSTKPKRADIARLADDLEKIMTRTPGGFPAIWGAAAPKTADEMAPALRGDLDRAQKIADRWGAITQAAQRLKTEQPQPCELYRAFLFRWQCAPKKKTARAKAIADYAQFHSVPLEEVERAAAVPQMIAAAAIASSPSLADCKKQTAKGKL